MKTELNSKEYVSFARRFVKETVATMDIDELRSIVTNHIHEEIQNGENDYGQEGAFEEEITSASGWCIKSIDYDIQLKEDF